MSGSRAGECVSRAPTRRARRRRGPTPSGARGAAAVDGDLEVIRAAEQRARARPAAHRRTSDTTRGSGHAPTSQTSALLRQQRSTVRRSMLVMRLPKRSTRTHLADAPGPSSTRGSGTSRRIEHRRRRGRAPSSSMPFASHAAAGAKRSRPSNVRLTVGRAYAAFGQLDDGVGRRPRRAPGRSTPLSGATNR